MQIQNFVRRFHTNQTLSSLKKLCVFSPPILLIARCPLSFLNSNYHSCPQNVPQTQNPYTQMDYYMYIGIPDMYMSTLVWSHNEFLASILACITLGSIILMVMVSALIAGVKSGGVRF